jgi:hypothetical protein
MTENHVSNSNYTVISANKFANIQRLLGHKADENPSTLSIKAISEHLSVQRSYEDLEYLCLELAKRIDDLERKNHNQKVLLSLTRLNS